MRVVTVEVREISDKRILIASESISPEMIEDFAYHPGEAFLQAYYKARGEIEDRLLDEQEEERRIANPD